MADDPDGLVVDGDEDDDGDDHYFPFFRVFCQLYDRIICALVFFHR